MTTKAFDMLGLIGKDVEYRSRGTDAGSKEEAVHQSEYWIAFECRAENHRIPTVQKGAIWPIEPAPSTIPPRLYPRNPAYLPCKSR